MKPFFTFHDFRSAKVKGDISSNAVDECVVAANEKVAPLLEELDNQSNIIADAVLELTDVKEENERLREQVAMLLSQPSPLVTESKITLMMKALKGEEELSQQAAFPLEGKTQLYQAWKRINELEEALKDFRDMGVRADLNPTQPVLDWSKVTVFFLDYLKRIDDSVRERARAALECQGKPDGEEK